MTTEARNPNGAATRFAPGTNPAYLAYMSKIQSHSSAREFLDEAGNAYSAVRPYLPSSQSLYTAIGEAASRRYGAAAYTFGLGAMDRIWKKFGKSPKGSGKYRTFYESLNKKKRQKLKEGYQMFRYKHGRKASANAYGASQSRFKGGRYPESSFNRKFYKNFSFDRKKKKPSYFNKPSSFLPYFAQQYLRRY